MYNISYSKQFKKDLKTISKNAKFPVKEFEKILNQLSNKKTLEAKYKNHKLKGTYIGCYECHIKPDILLIYKIKDNKLLLLLLRIGSHSNLFS